MKNIKLMYITNQPCVALVAEKNGVDRIFVDMEFIGKDLRQGGMDTVQSRHTLSDVKNIRKVLTKSELLVRANPVHDAIASFSSTEDEINGIIESGADIIMLPYFKTAKEVERFIKAVDGRAKTLLLFETVAAYENADEILTLSGIDEVFIGLNDLSLDFGKQFMFELLVDGTVEKLCDKFKAKGIPFGFGGIATPGAQVPLPAERILKEHYRLGSTCVILSRSFCNAQKLSTDELEVQFADGMAKIRESEREAEWLYREYPKALDKNHKEIVDIIDACVGAAL